MTDRAAPALMGGIFFCYNGSNIVSDSQQNREYTYTMQFTSIAVFVLFFGLALIEAIQNSSWLQAAIFLALGVLSLWADFSKKE